MASARFAWGIDIGNRALKAIKLVRGENGLQIDDFEVIEHENVLSNAGDNKEALIQSALANFVQRHPIAGGAAAISVSGVSSFARFIKLPPVEPKKIPEIVRFEAIQQIPFPLDDVEWAYQLFQAPDSPDVEVGIFAMRRELIDAHIKHFTDVDLNVQVVQMNPLAVYNAIAYDNRLDGTTMIIDLGAENTDLIIADGESVWLRSIPLGGNNFTEVLVKSFKLSFQKAEELKRNANTSKYARQIFQQMRPVFADLVAEIQRSIGFYSSVHRDSRIKKVIALGGTFRLAGLQKYLQQNLQLEVEKINEISAGAPADAKMATTFSQNLLSLVSAYGLAVQAMGDGKINSNLLPRHIQRERMWREKTKWFAAAAATFVLGTALAGGGYYYLNFAATQEKPLLDKNQGYLRQATLLSQKWTTQVENAGTDDRLKITNLRSMLDDRALWPNIISDIFAALPTPPSGDVKAITKTPRADRNIILIDRIESLYVPDLVRGPGATPNAPMPMPMPEPGYGAQPGMYGGPQPGYPPPGYPPSEMAQPGQPPPVASDPNLPPGSRGFIVTLSLTTPHHDGFVYVLNNLNKALKAMDRKAMDAYNKDHPDAPKHYYIASVLPPRNQIQLKEDPTRVAQLVTAHAAMLKLQSGGSDANTPAPVNPNGQVDNTAALTDSLTGEDRSNDWEMKVDVTVVIDPGPAADAPTPGS